jgi:putative transferase (TIGR04331 family)
MFLATTALEEFWDKDQKIVFLGEWCILAPNTCIYDSINYQVMDYIWSDIAKTQEAVTYTAIVYEKLLPLIAKQLNKYHGIDKNVGYWRLVLGNWLLIFIQVTYDRYVSMKLALATFSGLNTYVLDKSCYMVPSDFAEFQKWIIDDLYNLQLYSSIANFLNMDTIVVTVNLPTKHRIISVSNAKKSFKRKILDSLFGIANKISIANGAKTSLVSPNFEKLKDYVAFYIKSKMNVVFDEMSYSAEVEFCIDYAWRNSRVDLPANDEFEELLDGLLLSNIPAIFVEGFLEFRSKVLDLPIHKSKIFVTAQSLHANMIFKFFVAEYRNQIKLFAVQHGGGYGWDFINTPEEYEKSVSDCFYSWGWNGKNIKQLSSMKLHGIKHNIGIKKYVLYTTTDMPKWIYRLQNGPNSSDMRLKYIPAAKEFIGSVGKNVNMKVRLHPNQFGWNIGKSLCLGKENISFDESSNSFKKSLSECSLMVCDYFQTSFLESMSANKPTIVFIDSSINAFRFDAADILCELSIAKILFYSPTAAATHLNGIYDDIDAWWLSDAVQKTRSIFCDRYAKMSASWIDEWIDEFCNKQLEIK